MFEGEEDEDFGSFLLYIVRIYPVLLVACRRIFRSLSVENFLPDVRNLRLVVTVSRCVFVVFCRSQSKYLFVAGENKFVVRLRQWWSQAFRC